MGPKHCFPFMTRGDANIVVSGAQVKFGVDLGRTKLVNEVHDQWYGVSILSGNLVEVLKIDTEPKGAIFLVNRTGALPGELDAQIKPFPSILSRNPQRMPSSVPDRG